MKTMKLAMKLDEVPADRWKMLGNFIIGQLKNALLKRRAKRQNLK